MADGRAKAVSNWMLGELARLLNASGLEIGQAKITPNHLVGLLELIDKGTLSVTGAKKVFEVMFHTGRAAAQVVAEEGLTQISEASEVEGILAQVLAQNPQAVADFKVGKEQALKFLVGQVMKASKGRANPQMVNNLLRGKLSASS